MLWLVILLIPFSALALGAVHPWAFGLAELVSFVLVAVWMVKVAAGRSPLAASANGSSKLAALALGLVAVVGLQLVPLAPEVLRVISPETYALDSYGLPGWPSKAAYQWDAAVSLQAGRQRYMLPTPDEVRAGVRVPFAHPVTAASSTAAAPYLPAGAWEPLSVAPPMTRVGLLKLLMYCALGLWLLLYPFSEKQELRLYKNLVRTVLATGLVISLVGLAEQLFPNGKPLWIFSPYDWAGGSAWGARCFGPFANPDHFADYLAMVWPFALSGMLFPNLLGKVRDRIAVPILCGTVGLVVLAALLATASRGGWLAAVVGSGVVFALSARLPKDSQPGLFRGGTWPKRVVALGGALIVAVCVASLFTSTASRSEADTRLNSALQQESVWERTQVSRNSLPMIGEFPLFGVGLGAWPEIYPKYAPPPWDNVFMNAVHNEYIQFAAEVGLFGVVLGVGFIALAGLRIGSGIMALAPESFPIAIACAAALAAVATHSIFDFPLRVPANALLATICLGMLVRMCAGVGPRDEQSSAAGWRQRAAAAGILALCLVAIAVTVGQQRRPFPYDIRRPRTVDDAVADILRYPTSARLHLGLAQLLNLPSQTQIRDAELDAALELDPTNPGARDLYAAALVLSGKRTQALQEIQRSVFYAPDLGDHYYLNGRVIPWLMPDEQGAIIAGLKSASAAGYLPASNALALLYENLGRHREEGEFLEQAARSILDPAAKSAMLSRAGSAFANANDRLRAEQMLKEAIAADPRKTGAYRTLALGVYASSGRLDDAQRVIRQGIAAGAPRAPLYEALADAEISQHNLAAAEAALEKGVAIEPSNFELTDRLGELYASDNKLNLATVWLNRATRLNPQSAPAFFDLAQAEEDNYQFFAAERAYTHALALDASNPGYRARYAEFKRRVAEANSH